jgi:hypothetical protein
MDGADACLSGVACCSILISQELSTLFSSFNSRNRLRDGKET